VVLGKWNVDSPEGRLVGRRVFAYSQSLGFNTVPKITDSLPLANADGEGVVIRLAAGKADKSSEVGHASSVERG